MFIKGFDKNLRCRGMQFEIGKTYDTGYTENLELCSCKVFHFCKSLENVHEFYSAKVENNNRFCEIEVLGELVEDERKCGSNKIKILREITGEELAMLCGLKNGNTGLFNTGHRNTGDRNTGDRNTGHMNTGDMNTGDRNTGDMNTGDRNTGHMNTGDMNTGDRNTGHMNTGDMNTGDRNTGDRNTGHMNTGDRNTGHMNTGDMNTGDMNTGDRNTGDRNTGHRNTGHRNTGDMNTGMFNVCDRSTGLFNTEEKTVPIFNKDSGLTWKEIIYKDWYAALRSGSFKLTEWIWYTEEEMEDSPIRQAIKGYLKQYTFEEACLNWWDSLSNEAKELIKTIPNFDKEIFKQITGIEVEK